MKYQVGSNLPPNAPSYVERQADKDFYNALRVGQFCYVLNSRQSGKTSLCVHTMQRLEKAGFVCIYISLSSIGTQGVTFEQWYTTLIQYITDGGQIPFQISTWLSNRQHLSPMGQFQEFIKNVLLAEVTKNIIIFIDEIDSVLSLDFAVDDFLIFIRSCDKQWLDNSGHNRITFAFLGVAIPADLIQNKQLTPFNIASKIELDDFQFNEVAPLIKGLETKADRPDSVLKAILFNTGGQPFLTQKICKLVYDLEPFIHEGEESQRIETIVRSRVVEKWESQDNPEHLKTIRNRLNSKPELTIEMLSFYQQILNGDKVIVDHSSAKMGLILSGIVSQKYGELRVHNRIYETIFNLEWVEKELKNYRPYAQPLAKWIASKYQDQSCLLQGEELSKVMIWAENKNLGSHDFQFLQASQNLQLFDVQRKTKKQIAWGTAILGLSLIIAGGLTLFAWLDSRQSRLESQQSKLNALNDSAQTLLSSNSLPQALIASLTAGQLIKTASIKVPNELRSKITNTLQQVIDTRLLEGHEGEVISVTFSPDKLLIASAGEDKNVRIWNLKGENIDTLNGHTQKVWTVRFSPDSKTIATASWDGTVKLWQQRDKNNKRWKCIKTLEGHKGWVFSVSFSPDRKVLASVGVDKIIRIWNLDNYDLTEWDSEHTKNVVSVSFSPDSQTIATASDDGTAKLWNWKQKDKELLIFKKHTDEVNSVSFSPDGKTLVTASDDNTAKIWNLKGELLQTLDNKKEKSISPDRKLMSANFSPNGKTVVTAGFDKTVKIWGAKDGKLKSPLLPKHPAWVWDANFSPDGQFLASAGRDGKVRIWPIKNDQAQRSELKDLIKQGCNALGDYTKKPNYGFVINSEAMKNCNKEITQNTP